ncbi:hypothetical protein RJ640_006629 [Escallonia rubra]|uniref:RRM domain-containing protein n=1 Tax=Escallonia rubra TaxID=112253 RepID=A0AA88UJR4_9ASTE|nr:hypothetical protein RJ640_006629 [Escallonia rubra]
MSHFGRAGPPDIRDTYSLLVLNITFRTTADDLFPLFDKYGKVVDVFIPRDRRSGDSRGFAFVRYKYADEAQKAVEKLDGRVVDGREIMVQFAKYGPNAERIHKGKIMEPLEKIKGRSRSRSPRPRDYRHQSRSRSGSPGYRKERGRAKDERRSRSGSYGSASPARRSPSPGRSPSPRRTPPSRGRSPAGNSNKEGSPIPRSVSPRGRVADSRTPSPRNSDAEVSHELHFYNCLDPDVGG